MSKLYTYTEKFYRVRKEDGNYLRNETFGVFEFHNQLNASNHIEMKRMIGAKIEEVNRNVTEKVTVL